MVSSKAGGTCTRVGPVAAPGVQNEEQQPQEAGASPAKRPDSHRVSCPHDSTMNAISVTINTTWQCPQTRAALRSRGYALRGTTMAHLVRSDVPAALSDPQGRRA